MSVEHYENFPVASWLCPAPLRPPIQAIYHFARTADDLADEGDAAPPERLQDLADYRRELQHCLAGQASGPRWPKVFGPLRQAVERHALPAPLLHALLDAFEQDVRNPPYATRGELLHYCERSANPVGRLLLHLYGRNDERSLAQSDAICSALQLINFWQDLSVDLPRGRCYVPGQDARRHNLTPGALPSRDTPQTQALVADLCQWAGELMCHGAPLAWRMHGRVGMELRLVVHGGLCILEKIAGMNHLALSQRPTVGKRDAPRLLWRSLPWVSHPPQFRSG